MMTQLFQKRLSKLNSRQRQAVDNIDGPLLVLAGPGTGKTELLSMRAASILQQTDTLPSSILCLTYTDSGAAAMRERLSQIIGSDAYKVAIHTFHSFGSDIINRNREYFFSGAEFRAADALTQQEILAEIFAELDYTNPLAGNLAGQYTHLDDALTVISELKKSGLTSNELLAILDANDVALDSIEKDIANIFSNRISKSTAHLLAPLAEVVAAAPQPSLPSGITPLANVLALSIAHAIDQAIETDSTKPITAWKAEWLEKDTSGGFVFKDRRRQSKLRAMAPIYYEYLSRMEQSGLYDYDDMILNVIHAIETNPALKANLQEQFLYIMVDEFQDTNLAQLRLLFNLAPDASSNVMAVGDDDQAIYSFQGADISNIHSFRTRYDNPPIITLVDNYRSAPSILDAARQLITQGSSRLEDSIDGLSKQLTAHRSAADSDVRYSVYAAKSAERYAIANQIAQQINSGTSAQDIAVFARRHHELVAMLPYFTKAGVLVNYERRDNALDHELVILLEQLLRLIDAVRNGEHDQANASLPEIVNHPAFGFSPADVYRLSLKAWRDRSDWLEVMQTMPVFEPFANWILAREAAISIEPLEQQIDELLGNARREGRTENTETYASPIYNYYFSEAKLDQQPDLYLSALEALRTIRDKAREHFQVSAPTVADLLNFIDLHRDTNTALMTVRHRASAIDGHINLMTVHKSKGLEFDHVYLTGLIDSAWGERVRAKSRLISYPANLTLANAGDNYDERLRLAYVGFTRAKQTLHISLATDNAASRPQLPASFLTDIAIEPVEHNTTDSISSLEDTEILDWRGHLANPITQDMRELLQPTLDSYKLSATHLGNFLDVARGGPAHFLTTNLLRFPQAKSPHAEYGTVIHATLQRAHDQFRATGQRRAPEDIISDFERRLAERNLTGTDHDQFVRRGIDALGSFLGEKYQSFNANQYTELGFAGQGVTLGEVRLTGALDMAEIDTRAKTIHITDYKTGKPSRDWKGKTDYEKMKLHRYKQQLMFYQLLIENSRDYSQYQLTGGALQFVEPAANGDILALEQPRMATEELEDFKTLIAAVWQAIMTLDLPDTSGYQPTVDGIRQFEADIVDKYLS